MELLTIGAFARAARLSPKALRLYDELGLLRPAAVDPASGYRLYSTEQLDHARLVAWMRRLGMPLARIRTVCSLPPAAAATEVAAFWEQVETETSARRELAAFLVDHLSRKDTAMTGTPTTWTLRYASRTDRGLVRAVNQDVVHASDRLLAVADGFGAAPASTVAMGAFTAPITAGTVLDALQEAARRADESVRDLAIDGVGTTLTAMAWSGSQLALVHIGDSRAYLLRDGELFRLTDDHTVVQALIDDGTLTPVEAESHPQRSILIRALHGGDPAVPDLRTHEVQAGDRYLLCSDGLHTVLPGDVLRRTIGAHADPQRAVDELIRLVHEAGAPDNVACVVADLVPA